MFWLLTASLFSGNDFHWLYGIIYIAKVGYDWMPEIGCPRSKHRATCKRKVKQQTTEWGNSCSPEQGDNGRIKMPHAIATDLCNINDAVQSIRASFSLPEQKDWSSPSPMEKLPIVKNDWSINLNIVCATQIILGIQLYIYTTQHKYSAIRRHLEEHSLPQSLLFHAWP